MQRIIVIIYVIVTAIIALTSTIFEIQPALFIINIFAPNEGDKYYIKVVMLLTWLILLLPLLIYFVITKLTRIKSDQKIDPNRTGIIVTRKKSFQSALVGIPIFVNDNKARVVDNGKTKFFETPSGMHTVQAGNGKQASEKIQTNILERKQLSFEMEIKQAGLYLKYVLKQV